MNDLLFASSCCGGADVSRKCLKYRFCSLYCRNHNTMWKNGMSEMAKGSKNLWLYLKFMLNEKNYFRYHLHNCFFLVILSRYKWRGLVTWQISNCSTVKWRHLEYRVVTTFGICLINSFQRYMTWHIFEQNFVTIWTIEVLNDLTKAWK